MGHPLAGDVRSRTCETGPISCVDHAEYRLREDGTRAKPTTLGVCRPDNRAGLWWRAWAVMTCRNSRELMRVEAGAEDRRALQS